MIISASRRTDIPAFYAKWFIHRIREGYCMVPNPFNPNQVSRISLKPEDVDVIVFWTRYARPLMPFLNELDDRGYRYYFLYTLMNNPRALEPKSPSHERSLNTFQSLSNRIGMEKVIWRYDPIVFTRITDPNFHRETYQSYWSEQLKGYTEPLHHQYGGYLSKGSKKAEVAGGGKESPSLEPPEENLGELMKEYLRFRCNERDGNSELCRRLNVCILRHYSRGNVSTTN